MIHEKLLNYLTFRNGFYIEAGAYDGIFQSNTYLLERKLGWKGILIEPSLSVYNECIMNRDTNKNLILNYALLEHGNFKKAIGHFDGSCRSMLHPKGKYSVDATTLTNILDKYKVKWIDFLSLDVEGHELPVLRGLDFTRYKPTFILVEIRKMFYNDIVKYLKEYNLIDNLSKFEDSIHNDYLFKLKDDIHLEWYNKAIEKRS